MAATQPTVLMAIRTPRPQAWGWIALALGSTLAVGVAVLLRSGAGQDGTELALKMTGRLAFVFFWPAYLGGALARLFGVKFDGFTRRGRVLGLAFATALGVHLTLVAWLSWIGDLPGLRTFVIFGFGVVWTALLALGSLKNIGGLVGPLGWLVLRNVGMNYLLLDFALDFFKPPPMRSLLLQIEYIPFQLLVILAVALRLGAWLKDRLQPAGA
jgi:hypothetical protein